MVCWRLLILRKMNPEGQAATKAKVAHAYAGRRSNNNSDKLKNRRK